MAVVVVVIAAGMHHVVVAQCETDCFCCVSLASFVPLSPGVTFSLRLFLSSAVFFHHCHLDSLAWSAFEWQKISSLRLDIVSCFRMQSWSRAVSMHIDLGSE